MWCGVAWCGGVIKSGACIYVEYSCVVWCGACYPPPCSRIPRRSPRRGQHTPAHPTQHKTSLILSAHKSELFPTSTYFCSYFCSYSYSFPAPVLLLPFSRPLQPFLLPTTSSAPPAPIPCTPLLSSSQSLVISIPAPVSLAPSSCSPPRHGWTAFPAPP